VPDATSHVILVDPFDQEIGCLEKLRAHELGMLHRAFSIFVFRQTASEMELLIHQRHRDKYHSGGLWTNTCCSHPRVGEELVESAQKRLFEEMGIRLPLTPVGHFIYRAQCSDTLIEHEYDHVLIGMDQGQPFTVHPEEVQDWKWVSLTMLKRDMVEHPEHYSAWLKPALEIAERAL
jgi:isopentenyl-diphosphate delta-isomerase type 1